MASLLFGNPCINKNEAINTGGGHECQEFRMFEAIKTVDVKVNYAEVVFEPGVPVVIKCERIGIKVEEVVESRGSERVSVLRRL